LGYDFTSVTNGHGPLARDRILNQPEELLEGFFVGEDGSGFDHFSELSIEALNGVRGVDDTPDGLWIAKHRRQLIPIFLPALQGNSILRPVSFYLLQSVNPLLDVTLDGLVLAYYHTNGS